jgi:hypothetical protein
LITVPSLYSIDCRTQFRLVLLKKITLRSRELLIAQRFSILTNLNIDTVVSTQVEVGRRVIPSSYIVLKPQVPILGNDFFR